MNTSEFVDPDDCKSCGLCCTQFQIAYRKDLKIKDSALFSEVQRFRDLETGKITVHEEGNLIYVNFDIPCKHLNVENGIYTCLIYNRERPKLCEQYPYDFSTGCPHKIKVEEIDCHRDNEKSGFFRKLCKKLAQAFASGR